MNFEQLLGRTASMYFGRPKNQLSDVLKKEAHKELMRMQVELQRHHTQKCLSPEPYIVDQMFHSNNPTFFYELDKAERMAALTEHLDELMHVVKAKNTKEDRLKRKSHLKAKETLKKGKEKSWMLDAPYASSTTHGPIQIAT